MRAIWSRRGAFVATTKGRLISLCGMNTIDGQPELTKAPASSEKKLFSQADETNLTTGYNSGETSSTT
ncbi:hypothetical protein WKK05_07280 [Nostoc sp. UHCC 0302]|uniref:hypothetical protein n=1 Tax=Nostoc sp. UHCC 0302 TaxID=3134896 RepID=UPI00311C9922